MPEPAADETLGTIPDPGRIAAVESLIGLAQNHISAGLSRGANIDTQALGLIGLDVGLLAVAVAAQEALGPLWWAAAPGLAVSLVIAGSVPAVTRFDLGPRPEQLYEQIETAAMSGERIMATLLVNLVETDRSNQAPLRSKTTRLLLAISALVLTIIYTTLLIVL
jgi:hypothetical protein